MTRSGFRGHKNVLHALFPLVFASVCTIEWCGVSGDCAFTDIQSIAFQSYTALDLKWIIIRNDISVDVLSDFARENRDLLSALSA